MRTVWKYSFGLNNPRADLYMPAGAIPRHVAMQDDYVCFWAEVDTTDRKKTRSFQIIGTGHEMPANGHYVGTCQQGPFVWHVVELVG